MKVMLRILAIALVLAIGLGVFASCGGSGTGFEGTYKCTRVKYVGEEDPTETEDWIIELKNGGKAVSKRDDFEYDSEWTLDGETFTFTETFQTISLEYTGTLKNGVIDVYDGDPTNDFTREIRFELQK